MKLQIPAILTPILESSAPSALAEQWFYTHAMALDRVAFAAPTDAAAMPPPPVTAGHRLQAVNGRWSVPDLPSGCAATLEDAAILAVMVDADTTVALELRTLLSAAQPVASHVTLKLNLGQGAQVRLYDQPDAGGGALQMVTLLAELATGANLTHLRMQALPRSAHYFSRTLVSVASRAHYDFFGATRGAAISRQQLNVRLTGPNATTRLQGTYQIDDMQQAAHVVEVAHEAPDCQSQQHFRGIAGGTSRGAFQGRICVAQDAQRTDAQQLHKALLLSPRAEIDAKPELEIFADDVKCSHGATIGALDDNMLFYLRARGIGEARARQLLTRAFIAELTDSAPDFGPAAQAMLGAGDA